MVPEKNLKFLQDLEVLLIGHAQETEIVLNDENGELFIGGKDNRAFQISFPVDPVTALLTVEYTSGMEQKCLKLSPGYWDKTTHG